MMKVHVVNTQNISYYGRHLEEMHRQRKKMFVDRLGWSELDDGSELEIDEFDNEHAHYLLLIDDVGHLLASCRVSPTDKPNVSCDKLAKYFDGNPPRSESVWEVSRWLPAPGIRGLNETCSNMMMMSLFEFGLSRNLSLMISCVGRIVTRAIARAGIPLEKISKPVRFDQGTAFGIQFIPSATTLAHLRREFRIFEPITVELSGGPTLGTHLSALKHTLIHEVAELSDESALLSVLQHVHELSINSRGASLQDLETYISDFKKQALVQ